MVTIEENSVAAGAGSAVNEFLNREAFVIEILNLGVPDTFIHQDTPGKMLAACGLDENGILQSIRDRVSSLELKKLDPSLRSG